MIKEMKAAFRTGLLLMIEAVPFVFMLVFLVATLGFLMWLTIPAEAACQKSYVCNGSQCGYRDVCTSTLDLPSTNLAPLPSLPSMRLKPLPSMRLPPLGTSRCEYLQVNGSWRNVCR